MHGLAFTSQVNVYPETCILSRKRSCLRKIGLVKRTMIEFLMECGPCQTCQTCLPAHFLHDLSGPHTALEWRVQESTLIKEVGAWFEFRLCQEPSCAILLEKSLNHSDLSTSLSLKWGWWITLVFLNSSLSMTPLPVPCCTTLWISWFWSFWLLNYLI